MNLNQSSCGRTLRITNYIEILTSALVRIRLGKTEFSLFSGYTTSYVASFLCSLISFVLFRPTLAGQLSIKFPIMNDRKHLPFLGKTIKNSY